MTAFFFFFAAMIILVVKKTVHRLRMKSFGFGVGSSLLASYLALLTLFFPLFYSFFLPLFGESRLEL